MTTLLLSSSASRHREAEPRFCTPRTTSRETLGPAIALIAERLGKPLLPWQRLVADIGGEILDDGRPAYREVVFTVPRQSGKTVLTLAWEIQRAIGWGRAQNVVYTAQDGQAATKKMLQDQAPLLAPAKKQLLVSNIRKANGNVGFEFLNGSIIQPLPTTEDAGHGMSVHLAVKDELFADSDDRRDDALRPAMITIADAQVLACSTMGTEESIPWNALVERGRRAAESQRTSGVAYFEWSADADADPADPATWWSCMPALGHTVSESDVALEWESAASVGNENKFRRPYLNQQTKADDRVIPATVWGEVCDPNVEPSGSMVLAVDCTPERSAGAIAACSAGEVPLVALVDYRPGVAWLVERVAELAQRRSAPVVVDARGPAGSLVGELERAGVRVISAGSSDLVPASGQFYDAVLAKSLLVRREPALDAAVAAAVRVSSGDAWRWGRRNTQSDVSPLVAVTLALWGVRQAIDGPSVYEERGVLAF